MKRTFWAGVGYTFGLGTGWYVQRRVRRTVERVAPEQVRSDMADRSRQAVDRSRQAVGRARDAMYDLRDAAAEGMSTMRQEQADLLAEFGDDEALHRGPARGIQSRGDGRGYRPRR